MVEAGWVFGQCSAEKPWYVNVILTLTTYLIIVADHLYLLIEMVFPDGCVILEQDNVLRHKPKEGTKRFLRT